MTFLVDGKEYGGGPITWTFDQYAAAGFTADADLVAQRLPSQHLHPVRWFRGRAALVIDAWDCTVAVGDLPPVRYGGVQIAALVTCGRSAAPPVLPVVGQILPVVGDALGRRYGLGFWVLASIVTNRFAAEFYRVLFDEPASLGEVRVERGPEGMRFSAIDDVGKALSLEVPIGRTQRADSTASVYFVWGSQLLRRTQHVGAPHQSIRLGNSSARLDLGQHEWGDLARGLGLAARPMLGITQTGSFETLADRAAERVGSVEPQPNSAPSRTDPVQVPLVLQTPEGSPVVADQQLDRLPFSASGRFEPATRPTNGPRLAR